ncbi:MAG: hypothetical protein WD875_17635 [Pirellulales bacterium]
MSSGSSPSEPSGSRPSGEQLGDAAGAAAIDPALLERVVKQTLEAADEQDISSAVDLQRLRSIAHRRKGQNLVLEPVVIEMVRAMLGAEFAGLDADPERFREISMRIARTLLEDPVSCKRLENLWARLAES